MKLASYIFQGQPSYGLVVGEGVVDIPSRLPVRCARCWRPFKAARPQ